MQLFNKLNNKITSTNRRDWIIMIFSLLLALFMWSAQRFSGYYSTYFNFKIAINTNIEGRAQSVDASDLLVVRGRATGFYIISHMINGNDRLINISVDPKYVYSAPNEDDLFFVKSAEIGEIIQNAVGQKFECENFATEELYFNLPKIANKRVPIVFSSIFKYAPQYMPTTEVNLTPDSILIYGEEKLLNSIDQIYTKSIEVTDISSDVSGVIALSPIKDVRTSLNEVLYKQTVDRYVEKEFELKVNLLNSPSDKNIAVTPSQIKVRYRVPFSDKRTFTSADFLITADYHNSQNSDGVVKPTLSRLPSDIYSVVIEPKFVEVIAID